MLCHPHSRSAIRASDAALSWRRTPVRRVQDIGDARIEIAEDSAESPQPTPTKGTWLGSAHGNLVARGALMR